MSKNLIKNVKEIRAQGAIFIRNQDTKAYINQVVKLYETGKIGNIKTALNIVQKLGTAGKSKAISTIESYNKPIKTEKTTGKRVSLDIEDDDEPIVLYNKKVKVAERIKIKR